MFGTYLWGKGIKTNQASALLRKHVQQARFKLEANGLTSLFLTPQDQALIKRILVIVNRAEYHTQVALFKYKKFERSLANFIGTFCFNILLYAGRRQDNP